MRPGEPGQAGHAAAASPAAPAALVVRCAKRWPDRLRGLLGKPPPAPGHGLLISPCASVHTAFMRYPIDVVFVARHGRILKVVEALRPWRAAACWRARHTLELAAGEARRLGLMTGVRVAIPSSDPPDPSPVGAGLPANAARQDPAPRAQRGATLVEFVVVGPLVLFILLVLMQYALLFHARSQLNYATFEAARAGTVANARPAAIRAAFERAMTGYHGGGTTTAELAAALARAGAEAPFTRIEVLSPTRESFDDYHSPALAARLGNPGRVIPNTHLAHLVCPIDRPGCRSDPAANVSGQTLQDANLLKLRITYGIPVGKQIPLAGPFMARAIAALDPADGDAFRAGLVASGRIPVVAHTVMRMQSPAIETGNPSAPGPGNGGTPIDPGPPPQGSGLPVCAVTDPACTTAPRPLPESGQPPGGCDPLTDPGCPSSPQRCEPPADWLQESLRPATTS